MKQTNENRYRTKLRLSEVERRLKRERIIVPPPSRATIIKMCEDGSLETVGNAPTTLGWLVYEDSFERWLDSLDK